MKVTTAQLNDTLKQYWGYDELKPLQRQIIKTILNNSDVLAVLSTGYGKSICYQLPFLLVNKTKSIIIISPLISLMEDQKDKLLKLDIPVVALNSNLSAKLKSEYIFSITEGKNMLIYMSPEYAVTAYDLINELYEKDRLLFIAIDEAHCISSWGNDFRPEYQQLSQFKEWMPDVTMLALTATANPHVREEIVNNLCFDKYYEFVSSFDRPNLYIECKEITDNINKDFVNYINDYMDKYVIIYVRTRDNTKKVNDILLNHNVKSSAYHAGLTATKRTEIQNNFINGKINWIVATVAFGMGIDQNIDLVIHYGSPGDLESYYQEIGRAGRNGNNASCIMLYGKNDMRINRILLKDIEDIKYKNYREKQITEMEKYIRTNHCRRKILLSYFGETYNNSCLSCDNCFRQQNINNEVQNKIQYPMFILKVILAELNINGGINKIKNIIMGKRTKTIAQYYSSNLYGLGMNYNENVWINMFQIGINNEYIAEETIKSGFGTVIKVLPKLVLWYNKKVFPYKKNKKLQTFKLDEYLSLSRELYEIYQIPSTCNNIESEIDKRKKTVLELSIEEGLSLDVQV